jgi:hypothetical protein
MGQGFWENGCIVHLELEMANLERFWRKTLLGPLGVKSSTKNAEILQNFTMALPKILEILK